MGNGGNMLKLEIKFDEAKIATEGQYKVESLYKTLINLFDKYDIVYEIEADGTYAFLGTGKSSDYGYFGQLITALKKQNWFLSNVSKWIWYNSDDGADEDDFAVEDVLLHYTNRKSAA